MLFRSSPEKVSLFSSPEKVGLFSSPEKVGLFSSPEKVGLYGVGTRYAQSDPFSTMILLSEKFSSYRRFLPR